MSEQIDTPAVEPTASAEEPTDSAAEPTTTETTSTEMTLPEVVQVETPQTETAPLVTNTTEAEPAAIEPSAETVVAVAAVEPASVEATPAEPVSTPVSEPAEPAEPAEEEPLVAAPVDATEIATETPAEIEVAADPVAAVVAPAESVLVTEPAAVMPPPEEPVVEKPAPVETPAAVEPAPVEEVVKVEAAPVVECAPVVVDEIKPLKTPVEKVSEPTKKSTATPSDSTPTSTTESTKISTKDTPSKSTEESTVSRRAAETKSVTMAAEDAAVPEAEPAAAPAEPMAAPAEPEAPVEPPTVVVHEPEAYSAPSVSVGPDPARVASAIMAAAPEHFDSNLKDSYMQNVAHYTTQILPKTQTARRLVTQQNNLMDRLKTIRAEMERSEREIEEAVDEMDGLRRHTSRRNNQLPAWVNEYKESEIESDSYLNMPALSSTGDSGLPYQSRYQLSPSGAILKSPSGSHFLPLESTYSGAASSRPYFPCLSSPYGMAAKQSRFLRNRRPRDEEIEFDGYEGHAASNRLQKRFANYNTGYTGPPAAGPSTGVATYEYRTRRNYDTVDADSIDNADVLRSAVGRYSSAYRDDDFSPLPSRRSHSYFEEPTLQYSPAPRRHVPIGGTVNVGDI